MATALIARKREDVTQHLDTGAARGLMVAVSYYTDTAGKSAVCLVDYDGPHDRSLYCRDVDLEMIRLTRMRLDELMEELEKNAEDQSFALSRETRVDFEILGANPSPVLR